MRRANLDEMVRGWFVGEFDPTVLSTPNVEIAVKRFSAGDRESRHKHRIATEVTAVIEGTAVMDGMELAPGDIVVVEPGEPVDFEALSDVTLVVAKVPGVKDDKYLV